MCENKIIKTSLNDKRDKFCGLRNKKIGKDTHTLRSLDWDRSRFDIEFGLRNGTTYNSFLIRSEKTALLDTSHLKFKDIWFEKLKQEINPIEIIKFFVGVYLISSQPEILSIYENIYIPKLIIMIYLGISLLISVYYSFMSKEKPELGLSN